METIHELKLRLHRIVKVISHDIGTRSYLETIKLNKTRDFIEEEIRRNSCHVQKQPFTAEGQTYQNIFTEIKGSKKPDEVFVIGAHYDTVAGTPGADDNASGIAGIIELSRLFAERPAAYTICLAAFCLEEPPFFRSEQMGSYLFARHLKKAGINIMGMISLEMIGYFSSREGSQYYPFPFFRFIYPKTGNYVAFVGNIRSRSLTKQFESAFRKVSSLPVESLNTASVVPGVDFSDHLSFWRFNFPAFMITDTAFYRNPHYHSPGDTHDTLNYEKMAELVFGIFKTLKTL